MTTGVYNFFTDTMREKVFQVSRFVISGATAAGATIGTLHILVSVFGIWYVTASAISFLVGFVVSFTLQKFWTFGNRDSWMRKEQIVVYLCIVLFNLGLNTMLVY